MAVEALGLSLITMEENGEEIPVASSVDKVDAEDGTLVSVEFNMAEYCRRNASQSG